MKLSRLRACTLSLSVFLALCLPACDTEGGSDSNADQADASAADAAPATGVCAAITCDGHGTCVEAANGLPTCDCDDGYELSGLDCIAQDPNAPEPPAEFACPVPGAADDPLLRKLLASRWYYVMNDRTCDLDAYKLIYTFRADGVFSIKSQFKPTAATKSGSFDYGCYTAVIDSTGAASRLVLSYDYENESSRNCSMLGHLADPPCTGELEARGATDLVLAATLEDNDELHLLRPVTDDACVWCSHAATCCPLGGWMSDSNGAICAP